MSNKRLELRTITFLLSVPVLSFKWGYRDNFSLFIQLHEAERSPPRTKVVNTINRQEYPLNKR